MYFFKVLTLFCLFLNCFYWSLNDWMGSNLNWYVIYYIDGSNTVFLSHLLLFVNCLAGCILLNWVIKRIYKAYILSIGWKFYSGSYFALTSSNEHCCFVHCFYILLFYRCGVILFVCGIKLKTEKPLIGNVWLGPLTTKVNNLVEIDKTCFEINSL